MHKTVIKAFLIEDNSGDVRLIKKMLSEATGVRFATECCTRLQSCLERLTKGGIDVILLDLGLPDSQGFETFNKVHEWAPALPIIVLTGLNDEELAAKAVRMGAQDYLLKGQLDSSLLVHAIRYAIERKRAEEALREKTNELAGMVAKLEASNRELDQFAYLVSRDLKAPLGAIVNLAQWIEDYIGGMLSGETKKYMELLRNRVLRMDAMIDALLQYSRVGRIQTQVEAVDVNALLTEVIDVVAPPPGFKIEVGANMPVIVMERGRLEQVFINLIDNAVKHHNRSNGRIK
ncbi:MAG: response regulator, partial [Eubacteriales bacterium]